MYDAGALGKRTIHQQDAKAQLLVNCSRSSEQPDFDADDSFQELNVTTTADPEDVSDILQSVRLENGPGEYQIFK